MNGNKKTILLLGANSTCKTYSLKRLILEHGDKVAYIDTDGKALLPFRGKKKIGKYIIPSDPLEVLQGIRALEQDDRIEYVVVDTISHWLRIMEQKHVIESEDSRGNWGKIYQAAIQDLFYFANNQSKKSWIFISHTMEGDIENFKTPVKAFVKGSTKSVGLESWFSVVVYTEAYDNDESETGVSYRFQVKKTRDTINLSVKTPEDMFEGPYVEPNDILLIFKAIDEYDDE
jgi:hypothetical protein